MSCTLIYTAWVEIQIIGGPRLPASGGDFYQFYIAGLVVHRGEVDRLYDQAYFGRLQTQGGEDPLFSLYPPMMAMAMAPLANLSCYHASRVWAGINIVCLLGSGWMLCRMLPLSRAWRINAMMALAVWLPVWVAVGTGHLVPVLLLVLTAALTLQLRGNWWWAGLLLSALAIKPQIITAVVLWLAVRRDWRALAGMAVGLLLQVAAVSVFLGPGVFLDYVHAMPTIREVPRSFRYSPVYEQAFSGIVRNLLEARGFAPQQRMLPMLLAHVLTAGAAAVLLCRVVWSVRPWQNGPHPRPLSHPAARGGRERGETPVWARKYECVCACLFLYLFSPYVLFYDLTLLAVPVVLLWSSPEWRTGILLYTAATVAAAVLYIVLGFSLVGVVALWTMFRLAVAVEPLRKTALFPRALSGAEYAAHGHA